MVPVGRLFPPGGVLPWGGAAVPPLRGVLPPGVCALWRPPGTATAAGGTHLVIKNRITYR